VHVNDPGSVDSLSVTVSLAIERLFKVSEAAVVDPVLGVLHSLLLPPPDVSEPQFKFFGCEILLLALLLRLSESATNAESFFDEVVMGSTPIQFLVLLAKTHRACHQTVLDSCGQGIGVLFTDLEMLVLRLHRLSILG